jgi:thiol:disulfide interchange protein
MRRFAFILMTILGLMLAGAASAQTRHVAMRLVAEGGVPAAGGAVTLAIEATPEPGWHAYWKNPGDAGIETVATWTLPDGWRAGPLRYPVPERLLVSGLMNYVYEKPHAYLVELIAPPELDGQWPVTVKLDYLVCTREICVPESQTLSTGLVAGEARPAAEVRARFDRWRAALPGPLGSPATYRVEAKRLRLAVPFPADAAIGEAYFYPAAGGAIDYAAPQTVTRDGDQLLIETAAAAGTPATGRVEGVLATGNGRGFTIAATPGAVTAARTAEGEGWATAAALAFLGALAGGLILNIMPCVFPILSLKALSLARSGADERGARREALAYTGGAVLACLGLGAAILALRAGGSAVGWAFQLQDPRMILVLLLLSVAIALNLGGLFEVPMPRFAGEGGAGGAFATGALAAFVATPCTGPFMGAALGAALVLPWGAALAVFAGLGLGLALPFLLIGFVPALRRRLPKPGTWMERFRRVLSVPMWLTAIALAWVLGQPAKVDAVTLALLAALALACVLWVAGARQRRGLSFGPMAAFALAGVVVASLALVPTGRGAAVAAAGTIPFSEARLQELRATNKPVFAYFTADWCLTCKVNEKAAIERQETADAFAKGGVQVLVGDWTDGDPALGRFIERHNRAGVPLYLWYAPGAAEPKVLPQVLTPGMLSDLAGG